MAIRSLPSNYGYKNNNNRYSVLNKPVGTTYLPSTYSQKEEEKEQNVGGLLGGIGYLGEKLAVGTVSSIEGIVDYLGSGFAKLFGNDQWAEQIISEDWFGDWYSHPEEWFNPDKGWQVAGDVAGGIGTSLPAMAATVGAAVATGGASALVQAGAGFGASFLTSGLGAAGRSTKEAYEESGELTGKEFGYGALSGLTEGGLEGATNLLGMGTGAIVKSITKSLAKETGEALLKNVAVEGLKSFAGEAFEEGVSEWITPYWKRVTYDPNAKEATSDEIMYSALVGGLSGLVMDGGRFAYDKSASYISGVRAAKSGTEAQILNEANDIAAFENENQTEEELFTEIIRIRDKLTKSLEATGGKATRVDQQMELGSLRRAVVAAASEIGVAKRAFNIINNADLISNRLTAYGYKRADGTQITYTADQLTAGYDKTRPQSIYKALKTNDTLRSLAIADFTGRLMMDTNKFKQATLTGQRLASQVDLNRFLQQATPEEVAAVSEALGITSWSGLTAEQFNQKITDFLTNGGVQKTLQANELKKTFKAIPAENAQGVPRIVNLNKDGIRRYTDGKLDIGVERKGDSYTVYDYNADTLSKGLDREGVNSVFRDYAKRNAEVGMQNAESVQETIPQAEPSGNQKYQSLVEDIKKFQSEVRDVDSFARKHVKEYAKLSQPSKDMVKNVILQGRKHGISDSDILMYAKVSAHSGIDIQFDKEANYRGVKKDGSADYADGFYEAAKNRIVVNPEGKRTAERLLIHELDHAIRKYFDSEGKPATRIYLEAIEGVDQATRDKITEAYKKTAKPGEAAATVMDETNAYYAEQVLGNKYTLEKLIEAEPTLKDKILSFFKGASTDYADVPKLSGAAKKYYRTYKKLFDEFSARNAQSNANEKTLTSMNQGNMQVSDRQYAFTDSESGTAHDSLLQYDDELRSIIENRGDKIIDTYDKLKSTVKEAFEKKDNKSTAFLGIIDAETLQKIKNNIPNLPKELEETLFKEGKQYSIALTMDSIRHMVDEKGLTEADIIDYIDKIADVIIDHDSVNFDYYIKGKNRTPGLLFKKSFADGTVITFDLVSQNKRSLLMQTLYMESSDYQKKKSAKSLPMQNASGNTSKTQVGQTSDNSIPENAENVKRIYEKIKSEYPEIERTLTESQATSLIVRGIEGDNLLNASDLAETILSVGGEIAPDASVIVYHGTSKENAEKINRTGKMYGKEDGLFFSTRSDGLVLDYGQSVVRVKIPIEKLILDDVFDSEVHLRLPVKPKVLTDVVVDKVEASSGKQYALDIDSEGENIDGKVVKPEKKDGNISKIKANMLSDKVYSRGEVERAVSNIRLFKALSSKDRTRLSNDLWVALNEHNRRKERVKATKEVFRKYIALVDPTKKIGINQAEIEDLAKNAVNELSKLIEGGKESYKKKIDNKVKGRIKEGVEGTQVRLKADYTTDKVFSQASVERGFAKIEAIKKIPKEVRERIARDLWLDLESSDGDDVRGILPIEYSVKLYQAIRDNDSSELTAAQRDALQRELRDTVREIVNSGRDSKWQKQKDNVRGIVRLEERVGAEYKSKIYQNLGKIKDKKYRRFTEASAYKGDVFKGSIDELTKIDWRGKFSANNARKEIKRLSEWYTEENPMLKGFETGNENSKTQHTTNFSMNIRYMLDMLSEGEGDFKNSELRMLSDVTEYFAKLVDEYDKVYVEGKWQDGEPLARELVDIVKKQDKVGVPIVVRALRNKFLSAGFRTFGDALSVMKLADMYGDGLFTRYYNEWLQGEINADAEAMKIKEKYDAFMKENPKFLKNAETETVKLHGIDVRKIDLISYAMTLKRKQAWESIAEGGVVFRDPKDGRGSHIYPTAEVVKGEGYSKRLEATMQAELDNVMSMLSEKDIQYMKVLEAGFELARTTKAMGDMQRYGFVSVIDGYYYPIKHEYTSHLSAFDVELIATDRYANASFNKSQTEGAKSAIIISSADATFNSHVKGVSRYLYLSPVMDSFNKLYKLQLNTEGNGDIITSDVRGNSYSLQSVIDQSKSAWRQDGKLVGFDYLQNLMLDTMGMGKNVGDDFAAKLRGAAVTFSLGANPKVIVTQLSSLISSTSILSYGSHFKALGIWNGNVDNYSVVAKLRNSDYTVAKAEGVIDRINTWSRVFTAGISLMDRFVVYRTWAACQAEVAKNKGPAVGTEENRIAAGKLLDKVILETQQNSLTSRRTEGARRGNILTKQMQMYKSDAITSFGRAVDGWGEMNYLGALLKSNTLTDAERATIQNRFEESKKKLAKSVGSIVGQAAFMMLVTEIFRNFYGKNDDETEEEKRTRLVVDAIGNLVNGVPVVSEVVSAITSNFGFETMEFSALNDFFDTAKGVIDYTEKKLEGKATERDGNKLMQNLLYTAGQLTGVPTRNMKNVSYGVVRLFSKDAAYKWDNAIYKKNYSADLNEAVAKGDMNRATMIMELALGEKLGGGFSTEAIGELTRLAGLGEKIIPGAISDTITVDGEEFVLNGEQYEAVKAEYDKVISAVNSFIESKFYNSLTDDQRAKALRKLYSTYKDVSYDRALGTQKNPKANLISTLLGENVFNAYLTLGVIESDVDSSGKTISGSKRAKVVKAIGELGVSVEERLLLICASGYSLKDGDIRGVTAEAAKTRLLKYILRIRGLTADERLEIAEMCGFETKNGKIVNNFSKKLQKISKK